MALTYAERCAQYVLRPLFDVEPFLVDRRRSKIADVLFVYDDWMGALIVL